MGKVDARAIILARDNLMKLVREKGLRNKNLIPGDPVLDVFLREWLLGTIEWYLISREDFYHMEDWQADAIKMLAGPDTQTAIKLLEINRGISFKCFYTEYFFHFTEQLRV